MDKEIHVAKPVFKHPDLSQVVNLPTRREKTFEDDLLRKLQAEQWQTFNQGKAEGETPIVRDENRTNYEDDLLEKVLTRTHANLAYRESMSLYPVHAESLMITSAVKLSDEMKETIVRKFIAKTGKPLRKITSVVDPSLLTGVRIQSETFYYEVSGKKQLREIRAFLEKGWLQGDEA